VSGIEDAFPVRTSAKLDESYMKFITSFWKTIIWAGIVLFLSLASGDNLPHPRWLMLPHIDKVVHFIMYFIFALVLIHDLKRSGKMRPHYSRNKIILISVLIVITWGGILEILQQIPAIHRNGDFSDVLANAAGAALAAAFYRIFGRYWMK